MNIRWFGAEVALFCCDEMVGIGFATWYELLMVVLKGGSMMVRRG